MSTTELADLRLRVETLTADERADLRAYLHFLELRDDARWQERVAAGVRESADGRSSSQEEVLALHQRLRAERK
ncbi:MAG TPA: hypothetical protein VEO95_09875 [Chthoniobacteraceae bacterium]|nr:hypothetical protein [Chthoniobacteraceae bacterium]